MIGMEDEYPPHRLLDDRIDLVALGGNPKVMRRKLPCKTGLLSGYCEGCPTEYLYAIAAIVGILAISRWLAIIRCVGSVMSVDRDRMRKARRPRRT
jgi:hypothetical protein